MKALLERLRATFSRPGDRSDYWDNICFYGANYERHTFGGRIGRRCQCGAVDYWESPAADPVPRTQFCGACGDCDYETGLLPTQEAVDLALMNHMVTCPVLDAREDAWDRRNADDTL